MIAKGIQTLKSNDFNFKFAVSGDSKLDTLIEVYNELINRIREERVHLKEQHFFLEKLIESAPYGLLILDFDGKIIQHNQRVLDILNLDRLSKDKTIQEYTHPLLAQINMDTKVQLLQMPSNQKIKCEVNTFYHRGFKRHFIVLNDLSLEILQSEKEAYGKVIRMMAHEVNNTIGASNSMLHSLADFYLEDVEAKKSAQIAISRNESLAYFMKNFASVIRVPEANKTTTDIMALLDKIVVFHQQKAEEQQIHIDIKSDVSVWKLNIDPHLIEQAFINIIKNAMESIGESGQITIVVQKNTKMIVFIDNGKGIPSKVEKDLFSPFFSTKPNGQGIGLMIISDILRKHQCRFSLETGEDKLTRFRIGF